MIEMLMLTALMVTTGDLYMLERRRSERRLI